MITPFIHWKCSNVVIRTKLAQAKDLLNTCFAWRDIVQARGMYTREI